MRRRIKIHHWEIQVIDFNKIYIDTTFDQTKKNRQIKKFQLIIPHDSKIRNSLSTKLKFHQKYVAAKRISFQKKESLNVTNNFNFQFSKKKKPYTFYRARHGQSKSIYQFPKHPPPLLPSSLAVFYIFNTKTTIEYQPATHPNWRWPKNECRVHCSPVVARFKLSIPGQRNRGITSVFKR